MLQQSLWRRSSILGVIYWQEIAQCYNSPNCFIPFPSRMSHLRIWKQGAHANAKEVGHPVLKEWVCGSAVCSISLKRPSVKYQALGGMYHYRWGPTVIQSWRLGLQACPVGGSWLSQSWHARRLSAANVLLTACHVSAYWRSEVEWNRSSGFHWDGKGRGKSGSVAAGWREPLWDFGMPSPHLHTCRKSSLICCLFRERGNVFIFLVLVCSVQLGDPREDVIHYLYPLESLRTPLEAPSKSRIHCKDIFRFWKHKLIVKYLIFKTLL